MTDMRLAQLPDGDLEAALRGLAPAVDWPSADRGPGQGDLAAAVRARIEAGLRPATVTDDRAPAREPSGWRWTWRPARRALVLALIALLALAAIAAAIGFGLPGLRIIFGGAPVSPPPSVEPSRSPAPGASGSSRATGVPGATLHLGERVELADLDARAGFHVRWPDDPTVGPPDAAYVDDQTGGQVSLVWAATPDLPATRDPGIGLLLSQFRGEADEGFFTKAVNGGTRIEPVSVGGADGFWLSGDPHIFFWQGPDGFVDDPRRWVGDTLLWSDGTITFRLETSLGRDAAIRLAETLD